MVIVFWGPEMIVAIYGIILISCLFIFFAQKDNEKFEKSKQRLLEITEFEIITNKKKER